MTSLFYAAVTVISIALLLGGSRWGIAALAFLLPISTRLPSVPIPALNTQNIVVLAGFAWLLATSKREGRMGRLHFAVPILLFCMLVTFAYINSSFFWTPNEWARRYDPYEVTVNYKGFLSCFLLYGLGCLATRRAEDVRYAITGLLAGTAFEGLFVCLEVGLNGPARANGHLSEPNSAGAYLAWAAVAGVAIVVTRGLSGRLGKLAIGTVGMCLFGLVFTLSRGNWMAAVIGSSFVTVLRDRRVLILLVIALLTHNFWLPQKAQSRLDETFGEVEAESSQVRNAGDVAAVQQVEAFQAMLAGGTDSGPDEEGLKLDGSSQVRLYVWLAAIQMIEDHPLGVGYGLFKFYLPEYSPVYRFRAAHNSYLLLAAETGVLGLLAFLVVLGLMMLESWRAYRACRDPLLRAVALAAVASTMSMAISSFFYNFWFNVQINGQQWMLLGIATQLRRIDLEAPDPTTDGEPEPDPGPRPLYELVS